jgi:multiple antibiotic resistance protein
MLAGPGAISTAILLHNKVTGLTWFTQQMLLCVAILVVGTIAYAILHLSAHGARWLNPIAMRITTRVMGLLLAAVAIQFVITALGTLGLLTR